ncbi:hypothetical protein AGMMS49949_08370 [Alphaproteobacteria bacterium]|nr:hypothetical protein AGMMS49949_08370 [Alphaproteobacteria bacterium]GHS99506.1 hypothetical protein AGMMS50296_7670 [Alphaproteobacteria bacterium]
MKMLYLIDVSGFIFRAFYALPPLVRPDGTPVGAVLGFCTMLLKLRDQILERSGGEALWCGAFDVSRTNFRQSLDPSYKANRKDVPPELIPQFALIREACEAFGCPVKEAPGFEADDVIASYVKKVRKNKGNCVVVSSDKDLMQLHGEGVEIFDPMKAKWIQPTDILEKFGVEAKDVVDVQALAGDPSDGVVGVPGIGVKTAAELIRQFGSLEVLLANAHTLSQTRRRALLKDYAESALLAKKLVTLYSDLDFPLDEASLQFPLKLSEEQCKTLSSFLERQGFTALKTKILNKI